MKNSKKLILGVLIFSLSLGLLPGCGKTSEKQPAAEPATTAVAPAVSEQATTAAEVEAEATAAKEECTEQTPSDSAWKEINRLTIEQKTNYAGFMTDTYGLTIGYAGEIHYTNDSGKTWPAAQNNSACRFGLDILDDKIAVCSGNSGHNRITKDGGKTWQELTDYGMAAPDHNKFVSIVDENTFWLASARKMACSKDSGKTWQEIEVKDEMGPIAAISFLTADEGFVLNAKGMLFATKDGGKTWSEQNIDFKKLNIKNGKLMAYTAPMACMRFPDAQNGELALYAIMDSGIGKVFILKTSDGGKTWSSEQLPGDHLLSTVFLSRDGKYLTLFNSPQKELTVFNEKG